MFINFGQSTNTYNHPVHIEPEPLRRGTSSLMCTCALTNFMCVWQAVHLNVPGPGKCGKYQQYGRRAALLVLGLIAPEVVAYVAWQQRRSANKLLKEVRDLLKEGHVPGERSAPEVSFISPPSKGILTRELKNHTPCMWSMTHAFYAIMGGFAVKLDEGVPGLARTDDNQYTVLPDGVRELLKSFPDSMTQLSAGEIKDKSKGDSITKALVMIQATYFIYQCVVRWQGHFPISILEHNTLGHALCSVLIYFLWWKKPLDVGKPTILENTQVKKILLDALTKLQPEDGAENTDAEKSGSPAPLQRFFRACCFPFINQFFLWLTKPDPVGVLAPRVTNRPKLKPKKPKKPGQIRLDECLINSVGVTLTLGVYTLLHLVAWNGLFTTRTEKRLWRTSSVILVLSSIVYFFQALWPIKREPLTWRVDFRESGSIALGFFIMLTLILCTLARLFLVVESYWNVFHLPADVYEMPLLRLTILVYFRSCQLVECFTVDKSESAGFSGVGTRMNHNSENLSFHSESL